MPTVDSAISLSLADLENLNIGQLARLYNKAATSIRIELPLNQRGGQQLGVEQPDIERQDRHADTPQVSKRHSHSDILANDRSVQPLVPGQFDDAETEPDRDEYQNSRLDARTDLLATQGNSRFLNLHLNNGTPELGRDTANRNVFQDSEATSRTDLLQGYRSDWQPIPDFNNKHTDVNHFEPEPTLPHERSSQLQTNHFASNRNGPHLNSLATFQTDFQTQFNHPDTSYHNRIEQSIPEEVAVGPLSPTPSWWRPTGITRSSIDAIRTWTRPSIDYGSRRSRSQKIARKPLPELLTWSGPNDPNNPMNWSVLRKRMVFLVTSAITFTVSYASSIFSAAVPAAAKHFQTSEEVMILSVSLYVLGFALGPLVFGPLSEVYGRRRPMFLGLSFFVILQFPVALAENLPAIFICRFLTGLAGSSVIAIFPAMTVDLFSASDRGPAIDLYLAAVFVGATLGPVTGGFLVEQPGLGWRWTIWIVLIVATVFCGIGVLVIPETCEAVLLQRKSTQVRFETKNWAMHTKYDENPITWQAQRQKYMLKPIVMMFQEPILILVTMYNSLVYGLLFLTFFAYPYSFGTVRHWRPQMANVPFLAVLVGFLIGIFVNTFVFNRWWKKRFLARELKLLPEDRLPPMFVGALLLPTGLFWFAWTSSPTTSPWPQILSGVAIGAGMTLIFVSSVAYLVDVYLLNANSALAANAFVRSCVAAAFPLFARYMYVRLGVDWATSLLGFLAVAMMPFPVVLWCWGKKIRGWSRFSFDF